MKPNDFRPFAEQLARASASVIMPLFGSHDLEVELKADETPVTKADRDAEACLRALIAKEFPDHGFIGEEFGSENEEAEYVWVLDPIDGTKSFASACPLFGTLIGLLHEQQPVLGVIHLPALDKLCIGTDDYTTVNGERVKCRTVASLAEASLLISDPRFVKTYQQEAPYQDLVDEVKLYRTWGDCFAYYLFAAGWADIALDPIMSPWDLLPLIPVVRGAGGIISAWNGGEVVGAESSVAACPELHPLVIQRLNP